MVNIAQAALDITELANKFKRLIELGDFLTAAGSLETAAAECATQCEAKRAELAAISTAIDEAETKLADVGNATIRAQDAANQALLEANTQAAEVLTQARSEAATVTEQAAADVESARRHLVSLQSDYDVLASEIETAKIELDQVHKKIADAKAAALAALQ